MSRADTYVAYLLRAAANPDAYDEYLWGAEGEADRDHDGFPEADCSGLRHAALRAAGLVDVRTTAEGYRRRASVIPGPSQPGDFFVLLRADGTAHHIGMYVGGGATVEAKGKDFGIIKSTVAVANKRGARWYRQKSINTFLGALSSMPERMLCIDTHGRHFFPLWASPTRGRFEAGTVYKRVPGKVGLWLKFLVDGKQSWGHSSKFTRA